MSSKASSKRRGSLYTEAHAKSGIDAKLPEIECWPNQYPGYEITIEFPEFTSICPRTGLPDFGKITLHYMPDKQCLEFKSLKMYFLAYRNLGIFYENVVNRILRDMVRAAKPKWARVIGEFSARGGMRGTIEARYPHLTAGVCGSMTTSDISFPSPPFGRKMQQERRRLSKKRSLMVRRERNVSGRVRSF